MNQINDTRIGNSYFDEITVHDKYDSVFAKGRRNRKKAASIISIISYAVICVTLMLFSNVSSMAEAESENIKRESEEIRFSTSEEEAKRPTTGAMASTTSSFEETEVSGVTSTVINVVAVTTPTPRPSVTDNTFSENQNKPDNKKKTKTKKKIISGKLTRKHGTSSMSTTKKRTTKASKSTKRKQHTKGNNKSKKKKKKQKKTKTVFKNLNSRRGKAIAIYRRLKEEGYKDGAIAGVLGNIQQESDFNENSGRSSGNKYLGLFQLSRYDRFGNCIQWCEKQGYSAWSIEGQTEFMIEELGSKTVRTYQFKHFTGYDKEDFKDIKSPEKAASVFVAGYEGAIQSGSGLNASWQQESKRRNYARYWYEELKDIA